MTNNNMLTNELIYKEKLKQLAFEKAANELLYKEAFLSALKDLYGNVAYGLGEALSFADVLAENASPKYSAAKATFQNVQDKTSDIKKKVEQTPELVAKVVKEKAQDAQQNAEDLAYKLGQTYGGAEQKAKQTAEDIKDTINKAKEKISPENLGSSFADTLGSTSRHGYDFAKRVGSGFLSQHGKNVIDALHSSNFFNEKTLGALKSFQKEKPLITGALASILPALAIGATGYLGKKGLKRIISKKASDTYYEECKYIGKVF